MNEEKRGVPDLWTAVMVVLLTVGVVAPNLPLETARPTETESAPITLSSRQDIDARLWQDPIAVVERYLKSENVNDNNKYMYPDCDEYDSILAINLFGDRYIEAAETRRRWRYAVISALLYEKYFPKTSNALGYFPFDASLNGTIEKTNVPYEIFRRKGDPPNSILLIWLNENIFPGFTQDDIEVNLYSLRNKLECNDKDKKITLIGPAGSSVLSKLIAVRINADKSELNIDVVSPSTTISTERLFERAATFCEKGNSKDTVDACHELRLDATICKEKSAECSVSLKDLAIARTTGTDERLAKALVQELMLRGVSCTDGVVLIGEADTHYSHALSESLVQSRHVICGKNNANNLRQFTYLRGLDGKVPNVKEEKDSTSEKENRDRANDDQAPVATAPPDHAEGRSQYDYLRRIGDQIRQLDSDRDFAAQGVKAIGIAGSDVYDKLIILQALRPLFKDAIFFTTDLDARYLHSDQNKWARNLIVASNFDLTLHYKLQGSAPPFRDAYQTATYLATLTALQDGPVQFWYRHEENWLRPQIFEIGRKHAVHLPTPAHGEDWREANNCAGGWATCTDIEPVREKQLPTVRTLFLWLGMIILGVGLVAVTSHRAHQWVDTSRKQLRATEQRRTRQIALVKNQLSVALIVFVLLACGLVYLALGWSLEDGTGEPFLWLEGVSVWPSLVLRFVGVLTTTALAVFFMFRMHDQAKEISHEFFGSGIPAPMKLDRPWWKAAIIGPYLDLTAFDEEGRANRKVEVAALWKNYLRATGWREKSWWIALALVWTLLVTLLAIKLSDVPNFPGRGDLVLGLHLGSLLVAVPLLWGTIFWVSYETRASANFVRTLCEERRELCKDIGWLRSCDETVKGQVSGACLPPYVLFQLIQRTVRRVQSLIYLPFILIFFMVVARAEFFDSMTFPPFLLFVTGLAAAYALYTAFTLRKTAEAARSQMVEHFENLLLESEQPKDSTSPSSDQIRLLMERIRNSREGAFAPFSSQPAVQAVLLPFGGYGGVQLLQYLLTNLNV